MRFESFLQFHLDRYPLIPGAGNFQFDMSLAWLKRLISRYYWELTFALIVCSDDSASWSSRALISIASRVYMGFFKNNLYSRFLLIFSSCRLWFSLSPVSDKRTRPPSAIPLGAWLTVFCEMPHRSPS